MNTHDIELPPLPRPQVPRIDADVDLMDIRRLANWCEKTAKDYARAAVEADRNRRGISNATQACNMQSTEPVKRKRRYAQGSALSEFGVIPMCDQVDDEPVTAECAREAVRLNAKAESAKSYLNVSYDKYGDCLYVVCDSNEPALSDEDDKGILYRRAISDGRLVGITILDFMGRHAESSDDSPQPVEPDRGEPVAWKWRRTPATKWECVGHWDSIEAKAAAEMESQGWEVVRLYDSPQPPPSR